jgi:hypothetical protein
MDASEIYSQKEHERIDFEDGTFKRRKIGNKRWQTYCKHDIQKVTCSDCNSVEALANSKRWCKICIDTLLSKERIRLGVELCKACDDKTSERIEITVRNMLKDLVKHPWSSADNATLGGSGCLNTRNRRRPDLSWFYKRLALNVEIDEDSHSSRDVSCELAKITDFASVATTLLSADIAVYVLRFNPHASICDTPLKERVEKLANRINELFATHDVAVTKNGGVPHVEYLFYGKQGQRHIQAASEATDAMIVL